MDGILLLNKSEGMTSNTALQKAKRLLEIKKAGHTGSLDPLATGMLPLCFGEARKICQFLLNADKCYQTTGLLGIKTNSADATGEVIVRVDEFTCSDSQLQEVLSQFKGPIKQIPSMFSALKFNGIPLYRFAREGIDIERKAREIVIHELKLDAFDGQYFSLTVCCSKGTYIRNLVEDIGDALGVGAHVTRLHRVHTSGLENRPMYSLDELETMTLLERRACLIPMDEALHHLNQVILSDEEVRALRQGKIIKNKIETDNKACIRLYDEKAEFIGLGELNTNADIKVKRLLSF
jgi:tRNA pseudouridine55 synthase